MYYRLYLISLLIFWYSCDDSTSNDGSTVGAMGGSTAGDMGV